MNKSNLVVYHYYEKDASYRDNFLHFLIFGLQEENDYVAIISGEHTLELSEFPNIKYVFTDPKKSDFGGYAHLINSSFDLRDYEFIFFINSSVRGPYLLPHTQPSWTQVFLNQMDADVGMVGASICTLKSDFRHSINYQKRYGGSPPFSHVQTMAYVVRRAVLEAIIKSGFYKEDRDNTKTLAIEDYEIHLSQLVLAQGWNLRCLLPELNQVDYRKPHANPNPSSTVGDPNEVLGYFGRSIHPYEGVFVKTNRDLFSDSYLKRLAYSMFQGRGADFTKSFNDSSSINKYLSDLKSESSDGKSVVDFSYLPGQQEDRAQLVALHAEVAQANERFKDLINSTSWKITAPIRRLKDWINSI
jgi:hypothetical protein